MGDALGTDSGDNVEDDLNEVSALAFSAQTDDRGGRYAYLASDKDLALGPCTDVDTAAYAAGQVCVYVGDIGNNRAPPRDVLRVFKFVEPAFDPHTGPVDQVVPVATVAYNYHDDARFGAPAGIHLNAEALFVDWAGVVGDADENAGDLYVVTKGTCAAAGQGGVGKIPVGNHRDVGPGDAAAASAAGDPTLTWVAGPPTQGAVACGDPHHRPWTGAAARGDRRLLALIRAGAPAAVYFFARGPDTTVAAALSGGGCDYVAATAGGLPDEGKYEAVAFVAGGGYAEISECGSASCAPTLYQWRLVYDGVAGPPAQEPGAGWAPIMEVAFEDKISAHFVFGDAAARDVFPCGADDVAGAELSNDLGAASSIYSRSPYDCRDYDLLRVAFTFRLSGYDALDSFVLELSLDDGAHYVVVESWSHSVAQEGVWFADTGAAASAALDNGRCYAGKVVVGQDRFQRDSFGDAVRIRLRNSANAGNDRVSLGRIRFEGQAEECSENAISV